MTTTEPLAGSWSAAPLGRVAAPIREQVVERLRDAIGQLQLKPGERLVERELMEQLGVSRTTVREAIRELAAEGLVTVVPQRGAIVSRPTQSEAADLYEVRASLETLLVQRFIERATGDEVDQLTEATAAYRRATEQDPDAITSVIRAKDGIYSVLLAGARSAPLRQLIENLQARVHVLRAASLSHPGRALEAVEEMEAIVRAIADRDILAATTLYSDHVRRAALTALVDFIE